MKAEKFHGYMGDESMIDDMDIAKVRGGGAMSQYSIPLDAFRVHGRDVCAAFGANLTRSLRIVKFWNTRMSRSRLNFFPELSGQAARLS